MVVVRVVYGMDSSCNGLQLAVTDRLMSHCICFTRRRKGLFVKMHGWQHESMAVAYQ